MHMTEVVYWLFACCIFASVDISTQCVAGKTYCGRDLAAVEGWLTVVEYHKYDHYFICDNVNHATSSRCTWGCGNSATQAYCKCQSGRRYCGDELNEISGWSRWAARTAYECNSAGNGVLKIKDCIGTCSNGRCNQECVVDKTYCGRDLAKLEGWETVVQSHKHDFHYICDKVNHATYSQCTSGCASSATNAYCKCKSGRRYCGSELNEISGWSRWAARTAYECNSAGNGALKIKDCIGTCSNGRCNQECVVNKTYCGRDLAMLEGWETVVESHKHDFHYICDKVNHVSYSQCTSGCASSATDAYCKCTPGKRYCGDELNEIKGWSRWTARTVYECNAAGNGVQKVKDCIGTCSNGRCNQECVVNKTYCGRDLAMLEGWETVVESHEHDYYFICDKVHHVSYSRCTSGCASSATNAYCKCQSNSRYCGHELNKLHGWSKWDNNTVYTSTDGTVEMTTSLTSCGNGTCANGICKPICDAGRHYCGHQLNDLEHWSIPTNRLNGLFRCSESGHSADVLATCSGERCADAEHVRCECVPTATYCGSELNQIGYRELQDNALYYCSHNRSLTVKSICTEGCIAAETSFCKVACSEGARYCGHELINTYSHLNHSSLYLCFDGVPTLRKACSTNCIGRAGKSRCQGECHVGRLYCGFELQQLQFHIEFPKNVYWCLNKTHVVMNESCSQKCVKNPYAHCPHQCTVGYRYCGHELKQLGFGGGTNTALYSCDRPLKLTPLKNCKGACIASMENSTCGPKDYSHFFSECGSLKSDSTLPFIAHGHTTEREAWPWMVSLQADAEHRCGGILIGKQWVLTAAHCVRRSITSMRFAVLGEYRQWQYDKGQVSVAIANVVRHPSYDESSMENDIALIQLAHEATYDRFVRSICLPSPSVADLSPERKCVVAGWGQMFRSVETNALQFGYLEILNNNVCHNAFRHQTETDYTFNSDLMICAGQGVETEDVITCPGDSGGPLMCQSTDGTWTAYGIVSYGFRDACASATMPLYSAFTKVSRFGSWIRETMNNLTLSNRASDSNTLYYVASMLDGNARSVDTTDDDYSDEERETTNDDEWAPVVPLFDGNNTNSKENEGE